MASSGLSLSSVPPHFLCPISLDLMSDPLTLTTGITFDRVSIVKWLAAGHRSCPVTRQAISTHEAVPNHTLRRIIYRWCLANVLSASSCASAPATKKLPSEALTGELSTFALRKGNVLFSEDNTSRASALAHSVPVIASVLPVLWPKAIPENLHLLRIFEESVAALSLFHLTDNDISVLAQPKVVSCIGWLLSNHECEVKLNTVQLLGKLLGPESKRTILIQSLGAHLPSIAERLVISLKTTPGFVTDPDVLNTLRCLCSSRRVSWKLIDLGLVEIAVHQLLSEVDSRVRIYENTLALLETLLSCAEGRAAAGQNVLVIPAIVKRLFTVSKCATECAINVLWKMCRHSYDDRVRYQAVKARVPAKLNQLLLQDDCCPKAERTGRHLSRLLRDYKQER